MTRIFRRIVRDAATTALLTCVEAVRDACERVLYDEATRAGNARYRLEVEACRRADAYTRKARERRRAS